jgi:hypothetical protein
MERIENKYLIPAPRVEALQNALAPYLRWDRYSEEHENKKYTVKSIYFDTNRLDFYQEKLSGLKRRKKLRIRGYNELSSDSQVFLEIKRKNGQLISKNRAPLMYKHLSELMLENGVEAYIISDCDGQNISNARSFLYYLRIMHLIPTIKIFYEREAHFARTNPFMRITLDSNLRSSLQVGLGMLYDDRNMIYALPNQTILEIKTSGGYPDWLQKILARLDLQLQAVSKYTNCMDNHSRFEHQLHGSIQGYRKFDAFRCKLKITDNEHA